MYLYVKENLMVSNLENLSEALTKQSNGASDEARLLTEKIKSDQKIQADLQENGIAYFRDAGRDFIVRRKVAAAGE
jgi:hypothetical protein